MMNNILNLNARRGFGLLQSWAKHYTGPKCGLIFSNVKPLGSGECKTNGDEAEIMVGISPFSTKLPFSLQPMDDDAFVTIGVSVFHELTHYSHRTQNETVLEIQLSDLSKYKNPLYYNYNWHKLPHEIYAEYSGVMSMWEQLEQIVPESADELMLRYVERRAEKTLYPIRCPENGLYSKEQVETLFDAAYEKSLTEYRQLPSNFLRSDDEVAQMLTNDGILIPEYVPVYKQLVTSCTDEKMSSLVAHMHPELQKMYRNVDFQSLNPNDVFGYDLPETPDEIKTRREGNNLAVSVSQIEYKSDITL